jgi:hypothetical protein
MLLIIGVRDLGSNGKVSKCCVISVGTYVFYSTRSNYCLRAPTLSCDVVEHVLSCRHSRQIDGLCMSTARLDSLKRRLPQAFANKSAASRWIDGHPI